MISEGYKSAYQQGYSDAMRDFSKKSKTNILDKIRAEIEQTAKDYDKFADYRRMYGLWIALDIIDKY